MENFRKGSVTGRLFFNAHLFLVDDCPLKFYLDGYNPYEFHAVSKIIEAYGGRLTLPDKETIIFSEPDRHVQNYYYRYDIKYVYDCIIANKMLDIQKYLLPRLMTSDMLIEELPRSNPTIRKRAEALNFQKNDASNRISKTPFPESALTIKKEPEDEIILIDGNAKLHESRQIRADKSILFFKKSSNTGTPKTVLVPVDTTNGRGERPRIKSEPGFPHKPELICLSDDSDSQVDNLPDSTKTISNSHFKPSVTQHNSKSENKYKHVTTASPNAPQTSDILVNSNLPYTSNGDVQCNAILNNHNHHCPCNVSSDSEGEFADLRRKDLMNKRPVARKSTTKNGETVVNNLNGKENTKVRKKFLYTDEENMKMIQYIIEKNAIPTSDRLAIWKQMEREKVFVNPYRSAPNVQMYFQRKLLQKAHQFTDDPRAQKEFKRLAYKRQRLFEAGS